MPDDPISSEVLARARAAWTKLMRRPVTWTGTGALPPDGRFVQAVLFYDARPDEYMDWLIVEAGGPDAGSAAPRPPRFWVRRGDNTEEPEQRAYLPREGETLAGPFPL
jgi:hypothetical protein